MAATNTFSQAEGQLSGSAQLIVETLKLWIGPPGFYIKVPQRVAKVS
jgi:hypothetical protein